MELCEACSAENFLDKPRRFPMESMGNRLFHSSQAGTCQIPRKPLNALRVLQVTAEGLDRSGVRGPLLLDGLLQKHILDFSRPRPLANANAYQNALFVTTPNLPTSQNVPGRNTPAHPRSGKSTVQGPVALVPRHRALLLTLSAYRFHFACQSKIVCFVPRDTASISHWLDIIRYQKAATTLMF